MNSIQELAARIRNLFTIGEITRRKDKRVQVTTRFGSVYELQELLPYGFSSRSRHGTALLVCEGGDSRSPVLLYLSDQEHAPEIDSGESALWNEDGATVVARKDGSVELNGKDFGGLVKIEELKTQLEKNRQILQIFLQVLQTPIPEPGNGAPSAFQAALAAALGGRSPGDFSNIENNKVNHGNGQT